MLANDMIVFISKNEVPYNTPLIIHVLKQKLKKDTLDVIVENGKVLCQVVQEGNNMIVKGQQPIKLCQYTQNTFNTQKDIQLANITKLNKSRQITTNDLKYINAQVIKNITSDVAPIESTNSSQQTKKEQFLFSTICSYLSETSLKQLLNMVTQKQSNFLNCKVKNAQFRIFFYNVSSIKRFALSDIDGTITAHDICFACKKCLKYKLVNQLWNFLLINEYYNNQKIIANQKQSKQLNQLMMSSKFDAFQLPIVLVSARNGKKMFRFLTDQIAIQCFGQLVPQINLLRSSGFFFPPHELRAAFKAAVTQHILTTLMRSVNCQRETNNMADNIQFNDVQTMGFGNAASDAVGFLAGGCNRVIIV